MKLKTIVAGAILPCLASLFVVTTHGQATAPAAGTGMVAGKVLNVATGRYLNNAQVSVEGTGNVGEFLKYLPGVTVDYVAADVRTVSVRGFADRFTSVSVDGMRTTSSVRAAQRGCLNLIGPQPPILPRRATALHSIAPGRRLRKN